MQKGESVMDSPFYFVLIYVALGETDESFGWLEPCPAEQVNRSKRRLKRVR